MDNMLIWCQRVLYVFGKGQISSSRSCGPWWLGSGVERSIGVVEDADTPRTGECQQQRVVKPLELVQILSIPPTRCMPVLLLPAAAVLCATWHGSPRAQYEMATCLVRSWRLITEVLQTAGRDDDLQSRGWQSNGWLAW
jgi:hypothetical protein